MLSASWFFVRKKDVWALRFALVAGILMFLWDIYELIFLPNPLVVAYGLIGAVQAGMSFLVLRKDFAAQQLVRLFYSEQ